MPSCLIRVQYAVAKHILHLACLGNGLSVQSKADSCILQGVKNISVQSSVSLQHLPYDVALETGLPKEIEGKLSFATQKLNEIVKAKSPSSKSGSLTKALPQVGATSLHWNESFGNAFLTFDCFQRHKSFLLNYPQICV